MSKVLELTKELIKKPSVTPLDEGCQDLIASRLKKLGFEINHLPFGEVSNLWATFGEGEKTLTDLVKRMINNNNKLPSQKELKEIPGIAFLQKPVYQNIEVNHKKNTNTKNLNL